jgi:phosphodiester glycosidase
MKILRLSAAAALVAGLAGSALAARSDAGVREPGLAVLRVGQWVSWWRPDSSPEPWGAEAPLGSGVAWRGGAHGFTWGELELRGAGEAWRTRVVVVRLDPRLVRLSLAPAFQENRSWSIADAGEAILALDAGQFRHALPWGWVVTRGHEVLPPEYGALAAAVIIDSSGGVRIVSPGSLAAQRRSGAAREAFQSYPMLLQQGVTPQALRYPGRGVNIEHRDARLALGTTRDGQVIIALTRFDAFGSAFGRVPFGLTSREMAAVMGALGCQDAVALDGGISGQLALRDGDGSIRSWPGIRPVPLGLVGRPNR